MEKDTKEIVGYVALKRTCDFLGAFNLEYFIFPEYREKGYASEALSMLIKKAFAGELVEKMESIRENVLERKLSVFDIIYIRTKSTNIASKLLAEKLGFTFDGINKKGFVCPDREMYCDELIYSLEK